MSPSNSRHATPIEQLSQLIEQWIKPVVEFIIRLRVQTAIVLIACLIFTRVDQTIEVYRAIALDTNITAALAATLSVAVLSVFVWYTSRFLELEHAPQPASGKTPNNWEDIISDQGPRILGVIPLISLGLGIFFAWQRSLSETAQGFLLLWLAFCALVVGVLYTLFVKRSQLLKGFLGSKQAGKGIFSPAWEIALGNLAYIAFSLFSLPLVTAATGSKFSSGAIAIFALAGILNLILYSWHKKYRNQIKLWFIVSLALTATFLFLPPTVIPNLFGTISVVATSLTIFVIVFSTIYNWGLSNRLPVLVFLVGIVVLASWFNWNDNHRFRQLAKLQNHQLPSLAESFKQWLASRPDLEQYSGQPYPVYIASAQGGGIFAAYHASTALAKLSEYVPNFPQHVFAISGVSGGSLGASAYSSLVKANDGTAQALSPQASQLFGQDLLSPLLTLGFFPDLLQRFLPFALNDWDRANGLEIAFEAAWNKLPLPDQLNPLQQSFYQQWQPQGKAPALLLNTTVVETGQRLVICPFEIKVPPTQEVNLGNGTAQKTIALNENNLDLKLSTAAGLSARFPFVTPVGWFNRSLDGAKVRLADGGYFDNSGIPTAIDVGQTLEKLDGAGKTFKLIYLAIVDQPVDTSNEPLQSPGLNEILSPIKVLFNARGARSQSAIELSTYSLNDGIADPFKLKLRTLYLQQTGRDLKLPLGWQISKRSQAFIDDQTRQPSECNSQEFRQAFAGNRLEKEVYNHNSCVAKSIENDLNHSLTSEN
jgi:predicted acylesterase/phospholipase RssA